MEAWFKPPKDKIIGVIGAAFFLGLALMLWQSGERTEESSWFGRQPTPTTGSPAPVATTAATDGAKINRGSELAGQEKLVEERVASALARIAGVGQADVRISLAQGTVSEYAINTNGNNRKVEERDKQGGTRVTSDATDTRQVVVLKEGGTGAQEKPVVVREMRYQVAGVLVVADGAKDPAIKEQIARAVSTLLDVPAHKVSIFAREVSK
ncbi:hypothetical protein [Heliophilum fasciatum]|uniref:Stage III sporulation protein AG n=1 Tax=Heliophilum fasciatum TaxID=35700 RepID=A0A4R2S7F4_9FIRM|nr:hypothetical protein [Heliophilum fasciatum]MCW2277328.1 stage III sporulation protein AG [Heliophilum fasciatum]TCP67165.1 stage III sporulation protein AG [Heliophilum fasciatum]